MSEIVDCISWVVRKTCMTFWIFMKFIGLRILDLLGLIFNIAACLTIVRLPCMIREFGDMDKLEQWRFVGLAQLLIFISDIPIMIAGAVLSLTVYRMFPLCKELKEADCKWDFNTDSIYYAGWEPRGIILKHFCLLLFDALFIPAGLICLLSWRCVIFVRAIRDAEDSWERRVECFKQLGFLFLDIPCMILGLICVCSWRLPFILQRIKEMNEDGRKWIWDDEKWLAFEQFFYLIIEIPCILCLLVSLFTWRMPFVIHKLNGIDLWKEEKQWKARKVCLAQFGLIFVDIPCMVCFMFVLLTIWRFPFFTQDFKAAMKQNGGRQWTIRISAVKQFGMLFVDAGCLFLGLILLVTIWRVYPLQRDVKRIVNKKYKATRSNSDAANAVEEAKQSTSAEQVAREEPRVEDNTEKSERVESEVAVINGNQEDGEAVEIFQRGVDQECDEDDKDDETCEDNEAGASNLSLNSVDSLHLPKNPRANPKKIQVGWKIRKAICLHFVMLLADIPAFVLLFLHMCTVIRLPSILSSFLQSGDFYMEFALTVYYQTYILFVDILFILLFILLVFLRPVTSWVSVFEDEDHMKYRLLRHHMQWIPDAVAKRHRVYTELDELVTINLKMYSLPASFRLTVSYIMESYIGDLRKVKDKMASLELDPDYLHLIEAVMWWENKRVDKIVRQYTCEYNYLLRPDSNVRRENMFKLQREMLIFDGKVSQQYRELEKFDLTKVPLWTAATGLSTRTRKETQKVLIQCLPHGDVFLVLIAILCCLPLYRAPMLIKKLCKRWYNRAEIITRTVKEFCLDFVTLLRVTLVIVFIYRAPSLLADISIDIVEKKSWKAVRRTAKRYPMLLWEDFLNLISTLLSWKTPRFFFTALLFGVLMPADMFLTAAKFCTTSKCNAYVISGALYAVFISFPFILSLYLGKKLLIIGLGWVSVPVTCVYVGLLLLILACLVRAFVRNKKDIVMVPKVPDYIHWNWYNVHVVIMEILELLQILALVFSLPNIPIYGGEILKEISSYLLFSFVSLQFKLWVPLVLFIVWFFLCGAPVIFEQILEDLPEGRCAGHMGWRMAVSLFSNTLFVTMLESFASCFSCSYTKCPSSISHQMLPANSTCLTAYLVDEKSYECWTGSHQYIALFGLLALVWYTTTSFMVGIQYGDPGTKRQDVDFSPAYNTIANFIKAIMVISVVNITIDNNAVLGVLIACNCLLVLHTLLFKKIFKYMPSNSRGFMVWRVASFSSGVIAAIAVVIAYAMKEPGNKMPLILFGAGTLVILLVAFVVSILLRRPGRLDKTREDFKRRILALQQRLTKDNNMLSSWKKQQRAWKHLLSGAREARPDDQFYEEADWTNLEVRDPETYEHAPTGTNSDKDDVENSECQTESQAVSPPAMGEVAADTESLGQETATIQAEAPPPPSYGSVAADATDLGLAPKINFSGGEQIAVSPCDNPLISLQRNGVNLLLVLEKSIHYKTYAYSFLAQRPMWLASVAVSNWTGLLHCLEVLESCLDQSFERPSRMDVSLGRPSLPNDVLDDDPRDEEQPPFYEPESRDPTVIAAKSDSLRLTALSDVSSVDEHGGHWRELMDKVLPTLPIIKLWSFKRGHFEITLKRASSGTIKDIGPNGIKLAKGASFTLGKQIKGTLREGTLTFYAGFEPRASKGPIALTVSDISFIWKKGAWYLETQGKTVKYSIALDSMKEIKWR